MLLLILLTAYVAGALYLMEAVSHVPLAKIFVPGQLNIPLIAIMGVGYLAMILALNIVVRMYLLRDVWARVVSSLTVYNLDAAANVSAQGEVANALGEGFADGLDVAGF